MNNLAIGYFNNENFIEKCSPYKSRIAEVFFAWPGVLSCRPALDFRDGKQERLIEELQWCRANGMQLDTLFNCNCYGDIAISETLQAQVLRTMEEMSQFNLLPNIVTTTSPFIATVIRRHFPQIELRGSINLRINGTLGYEYIPDLFDSYYVSREYQRDFAYMEHCATWAKQHGKKLGMQLNSGCLRECPYQQFHDNLHGHNRIKQTAEGARLNFDSFLCRKHFSQGNHEDILRGTWIRPEDASLFEKYVSIMKISTRNVTHPGKIVQAYATYHFDGNLLELLDPNHADTFAPHIIQNSAFPQNWATSSIATTCARNCTHCGRCSTILDLVHKIHKIHKIPLF